MSAVHIAGRELGPGAPCFVIAEAGINHNGDLELAHRLVDAAAEAGADAVKFQSYRTEDFVFNRSLTYSYLSGGKAVVESQYDLFKRCELASGALEELRRRCDQRGLVFLSTPTSEQGVADLVAAGAPALKNGSDYLGHVELIAAMARTGLPTLLSTGMSTAEEIEDAVAAFHAAGGKQLVLLHCTSSYPAPIADANLRRIPALACRFDCPVGLSDHTDGVLAAGAAVALGACAIEKHFTLDRALSGPDHRFSADPKELARLVETVRDVERALGSAELGPVASEAEGRAAFRLSCVAARDLPAGHRLEHEDVSFRRPGTGLPPKELPRIEGRVTVRPLTAGEPIREGDLA